MALNLSKYNVRPVEEAKTVTDLSKYKVTPTTQAPITPTKIGDKGLGGFATGFAKSLLGGATQTASLLQGAGQRIMSGLSGQKFSDIKTTTGIPGLRVGSEEYKQQQEMLKRIGKAEKTGGIVETIAEFAIPTNIANKGYKSIKTLDWLKNTPETISKFEERVASLTGRIKTSLTGIKKILPSETEKRASQILEGKISSNVTKNPQIIDKEIAERGQEVENYLTKNAKPVTAQEQANMFSEARKIMSDFATKAELKAYDELIQVFTKQIKGKFTTDNFYKALKKFEENVTRNLPKGKSALIGDNLGIGSARIRAAQDIRKVVRDMIGKKHPEFKGKMFDLASLYDVLDTAITKSRQLSGSAITRFTKNNPTISNLIKIGGGIVAGKVIFGNKEPNLSNVNSLGN